MSTWTLRDLLCSVTMPALVQGGSPSTHGPQSSSFLGLPCRILNIDHNKELLRGLRVEDSGFGGFGARDRTGKPGGAFILWQAIFGALKKLGVLNKEPQRNRDLDAHEIQLFSTPHNVHLKHPKPKPLTPL